ncbi:MAG: hypothetical protein MN733_07025 [Nitrososphaera sp.]|nr:hypothetical protein [Nitrososphaera sp.]
MIALWTVTVICGVLWVVLSIGPIREYVLDWLSSILGEWVDPWLSLIFIIVFTVLSILYAWTLEHPVNPMWIVAAGCGLLWEAWSNEAIRQYVIDLAERGLLPILSIIFVIFLLSGVWFDAQPIIVNFGPQPNQTEIKIVSSNMDNDSDSLQQETPKGAILKGKIIFRDDRNQTISLSGATIKVGQNDTVSNADGSFEVPLDSSPRGDTLVRVSHDNYISGFLRFDDPIISNRIPIELKPKLRIIVAEARDRGALQLNESQQSTIRTSLEHHLQGDEIELFADGRLRDAIVNKLHQYQEERALYDPQTLQRAGNFHGATHGVFWSVRTHGDRWVFDCKLVSFKTSKIIKTADVSVRSESLLDDESVNLASLLLARLAEIRILSPKTGTNSGHQLSLEGYALYRPKSWTLWITLLPEGNERHYPQRKITVKDDGSWFASSVYVGPEEYVNRPIEFRVYAVLTDPERTIEISRYLETGSNRGLDLNSWSDRQCRILDSIRVTRKDSVD